MKNYAASWFCKAIVGNTYNRLVSMFEHLVKLVLKGLKKIGRGSRSHFLKYKFIQMVICC